MEIRETSIIFLFCPFSLRGRYRFDVRRDVEWPNFPVNTQFFNQLVLGAPKISREPS